MIDLDELERKRAAAEAPTSRAEIEYLQCLLVAAPELIAMARRYQTLRRHVCIVGTEKCAEFHILNVRPTYVAPDSAVELDAVLDAMQEQKP